MNKIIIVIGETGSGKTDWVETFLNKDSNQKYAVINTDSVQMYKEIEIGNNKVNLNKDNTFGRSHTKTYLFNQYSPDKDFSVAEIQHQARRIISDCWANQIIPILVGGSGLYIANIIYEYKYDNTNIWDEEKHDFDKLELSELQDLLTKNGFDLSRLNNSDRNNPRRLINYLKKIRLGLNLDDIYPDNDSLPELFYDRQQLELINLTNQYTFDELTEKLEQRAKDMLIKGFLEEAETLNIKYGNKISQTILNASGYKQVFEFTEEYSVPQIKNDQKLYSDLIEKIVRSHLKLVKKQRKWNKKYFGLLI